MKLKVNTKALIVNSCSDSIYKSHAETSEDWCRQQMKSCYKLEQHQ